jgi:hypothetical protein
MIDLNKWLDIRSAWDALKLDREDTDSSFSALREQASQLGLRAIPTGWVIDQWMVLDHDLGDNLHLVETAASAWIRREQQEAARTQILKLVADYESANSASPYTMRGVPRTALASISR